ncbi:MAG TPA: hypothetical protein VEG44_08500 [Candidatus Acidoferrales bacterium]|nr:hypothetical protein [Candidatus Acidoferrales bacterium]
MSCEIIFPDTPEDIRSKNEIFNKISKFIQDSDILKFFKTIGGSENKQYVNFKSNKTKRRVILSSDQFDVNINCLQKLSIETNLVNPNENIGLVNQVVNSIIDYINFEMGGRAKESKIITSKMVCRGESTKNLSKQIIGEERLAELNKRARLSKSINQLLNPIGIIFEYIQEDKKYVLGIYSDIGAEMIYCYKDYMRPIHSDFLKNEYKELEAPEKLIKNLFQVELEQ